MAPCMPLRVWRALGIALNSALAHADVCVVHNDWAPWRDLTAVDYSGMGRKVVVDRRRILQREKRAGVALIVLGG